MVNELAAKVLKAAQVRGVLLGTTIPDAVAVYYMADGWHCSVPDAESPAFTDVPSALRWAFAEYVRQIDTLVTAKKQVVDEIKALIDQARDLRRGEG